MEGGDGARAAGVLVHEACCFGLSTTPATAPKGQRTQQTARRGAINGSPRGGGAAAPTSTGLVHSNLEWEVWCVVCGEGKNGHCSRSSPVPWAIPRCCMTRILSLLQHQAPSRSRMGANPAGKGDGDVWTGHSLPGVIVVSVSVWDGRTRWDTAGHGSPSWERRATTVWVANRNACAGGKIMQASCMSNVEARDSGQHQQPSTSKMISNKTCVAPRDLLLTNYLSSGRRTCRRRASRAARTEWARGGHLALGGMGAAWCCCIASDAFREQSSRGQAGDGHEKGGGGIPEGRGRGARLPEETWKAPSACTETTHGHGRATDGRPNECQETAHRFRFR